MKNLISAVAVLSLTGCLSAVPVMADEGIACDTYDNWQGVIEALGQEPVAMGMSDDGVILRLYQDKDGDWLTFLTDPGTGVTCLVQNGSGLIVNHGKPNV